MKLLTTLILLLALPAAADIVQVGPQADGSTVVTTRQSVRPAGDAVRFKGRPVDLVISPDGTTVFVKENRGLVVIDAATWAIRQELALPEKEGGSMHGIAISPDGAVVYLTTAANSLFEARADTTGTWAWAGATVFDGPRPKEKAFPCGIALTRNGARAFVCLSRNNTIAEVDLASRTVLRTLPTGVAPYEARLSDDEQSLYVSNWGGRHAAAGELSAPSSGTPVVVDERGVAASGTVSKFDLASSTEAWQVATGLHPSAMVLAEGVLYVANVNSDSITALDAATGATRATYPVQMDAAAGFGAMPNALALDTTAKRLYAACGGANAVAVLDLANGGAVSGWIPAGWYPGAVALRDSNLFVANVKGLGSRTKDETRTGWHVKWFTGTVNRVALPDADALAAHTKLAVAATRVRESVAAREKAQAEAKAVPVPKMPGQPSLIDHVVYIIKENRTYDQVFGDLPQGNGEPKLCVFPREYTPNHHALAEEFVLLDNYYCNGVVSADGHSWATEGIVTDHLEKSFGGFSRSYTFGDDPLTYASSGFIWDNVMAAGKTFRNFGEFDSTDLVPSTITFQQVWAQYTLDKSIPTVQHNIGVDRVKAHTAPGSIGWNMLIPDQYRADVFIRDLEEATKRGTWSNFTIIYLPNDHTSGTDEGKPTPRAHIADNDLALGRIVEAITNSPFWPKTAIFVNEDDPQDGFDHVDGHRSICLVVSPYAKRGKVVSEFYNQTSVLHTISLIMGAAPMNAMDAQATPMWDCFTKRADAAPFTALTANYALDEVNKKVATLQGEERRLALESAKLDLSRPDRAVEDTMNRIIWHAMKGVDAAYPTEWAGAHGRGLAKLGLSFGDGDEEEEEENESEEEEHGAGS